MVVIALLTSVGAVRSGTPDAGAPAHSLIGEGKALMRRGDLLAARERFEAAFDSTGDAEALFLAAECWEKTGDDEAATAHYQQYLRLPLALRVAEARSRVQAIEKRSSQTGAPAPAKPPRHVLVPVDLDGGACAAGCTAANVCFRPARKRTLRIDMDECLANRFTCLRGCPGATVASGACPKLSALHNLRCFPDRRTRDGTGWMPW